MKKTVVTLVAIFMSIFIFAQSNETKIFDKAVKKHFPEWKGYANYNWTNSDNPETKQGLTILQQIDSLDLSNDTLLKLPKEIAECPNLKFLNLLGNKNIDWQDAFTKISKTKINSVYVSVKDLNVIDSSYWHLITGIEILRNGLYSIPENILQQKQLEHLDLSCDRRASNHFSTLPKEFFELTSLEYLNLQYCQIDSLPPEIGNLTNLTRLILGKNKLSTLPPEIGKLTNLTVLDLWNNQLNTLPLEIGNLKNLTVLDLSISNLRYLPPEIGKLTNLTKLDLSWSGLRTLPPEIWNLTKLTKLDLSLNEFSTLPPEIGNLKNLTELYLIGNRLTTLPHEIWNLTKLTKLYLSLNQLITLPPEIGNLKNLTTLDLIENPIKLLPKELKDFLKSIPNLYLNGNLDSYFDKKSLTRLDLSDQHIEALSPEIGNFTDLTYLNLSYNHLKTLPPEIGNLKNLKELYLGNNNFSHKEKRKIKKLLPNCHIHFKSHSDWFRCCRKPSVVCGNGVY